jgi:hypothetical protein
MTSASCGATDIAGFQRSPSQRKRPLPARDLPVKKL